MAQPQHIQPMPAPSSWELMEARGPDGTPYIVLVFHTVTGPHYQFMDAAGAKGLAAALEQQATKVSSGLIVPNGVLPPAFGGPKP